MKRFSTRTRCRECCAQMYIGPDGRGKCPRCGLVVDRDAADRKLGRLMAGRTSAEDIEEILRGGA